MRKISQQPARLRYNAETLAAIQEARDIMSGKKKAKRYASLSELMKEFDAEDEEP